MGGGGKEREEKRKSNELLYLYLASPKNMRLELLTVLHQLKLMIREHTAFSFASCTLKKVRIKMTH